MENSKRPCRLSEVTQSFAKESLLGKYGDDAFNTPYICLDDIKDFEKLSLQERYNIAIQKIAEQSPIRITPYETVSGAATLGEAINHVVPAFYNGVAVCGSVSHLTLDFETVIFKGIDYFDSKIENRLKQKINTKQITELEGMKNVINALHIWHKRYLDALKHTNIEIYNNLKEVPFRPAKTFKEAVQSLWFIFAFTRLCGNWSGIGRIDFILGDFLNNDLKNGIITLDEAREFLAGFFIKGCEWIRSNAPTDSGDAQHYQNIVLAGIDCEGKEITNEVTYLVLDIIEELAISDFPITVRVNKNTPERLLTRVAEVMRYGGGIIAIYNEPLIINSLVKFGYEEKEARKFANDGCWEIQIPGKTHFIYYPFDSLQILLNNTLKLNTETPAEFNSFEELYSKFKNELHNTVESIFKSIVRDLTGNEYGEKWEWNKNIPCSVISLLEQDCIECASSYYNGGPEYTTISPHIGGAPDTGNSLYAIDKLVFKEKMISFKELMLILKNNWQGNELLREYALNKLIYYGNDNDESDSYTVRVLDDFANIALEFDGLAPFRFPAGVSTFGRQIEWAPSRNAVPFGRKKEAILSGNTSPSPGTDLNGATAIIKSYCKINLINQPSGAALDIKLSPSTIKGESGITVLKSLIKSFVELGGFFMQIDIVDNAILKKAQENPENYKNLSVRVSGWNARFITLNKEWQQMIIERSEQEI